MCVCVCVQHMGANTPRDRETQPLRKWTWCKTAPRLMGLWILRSSIAGRFRLLEVTVPCFQGGRGGFPFLVCRQKQFGDLTEVFRFVLPPGSHSPSNTVACFLPEGPLQHQSDDL